MSLFMRDSLGRLVPVNPGLPSPGRGNQGGMGARLSEADLMSRLPDADLAGAIGPGVKPGGEQAVGARRAKLEAEEAKSPPAPTYRPLGGAMQNNRGNAKLVTLPSTLGVEGTVRTSVVETSKSSGDDAEALSVQLALELPADFTDPAGGAFTVPLEIICVLEWGVGGAFFTAECDWNQGVSFTICASFLRVSARIVYTSSAEFSIVLKAGLGYGNSNSLNVSSSARRTIPLGNIGAGLDSAVTPIPAWAVGLTITDASPATPNCQISLQDTGAVFTPDALYVWNDRSNQANQVEGQFPIPSQCRFVVVRNLLGIATTATKLIFNLGF